MDYQNYVVTKRENFEAVTVGEDTILIPKQSAGEVQIENAIILNSIGLDIYNCINGQTNMVDIIQQIKMKYDVEESILRDDIYEFISTLTDQKVLQVEDCN